MYGHGSAHGASIKKKGKRVMQSLRPRMWALLVLVLGGAGAFAATQGAPVEAADHLDPPNRVHGAVAPAVDDRAADIADVFVWNRDNAGTQNTVLALSFDGPNPAGAHALTCDRDVVYQIHLTADGGICPTMADDGSGTHNVACSAPAAGHPCGQVTLAAGGTANCNASFADMQTINIRFAQNGMLGCVVQAEFVGGDGAAPISATAIRGAVETNIVSGNVSLYAGLRDDAFFFDLAGFRATLTSGTLSFTGADFFAGQNTPVVVLEFPTSAIARSAHALPPTGTVLRVWASTARFH